MNNVKIIKYEIKRFMFTKKFFYTLLLLCVYTYDLLTRVLENGFYGTAPFSKWSYSEFILMIASMSSVLIILLCTAVYDEKEENARKIIYSTPISKRKYYFIKIISILIVYTIAVLFPITMSLVYYNILFGFTAYSEFIEPILLFFIPSVIFILGLSLEAGKINVKLLYVLIPVIVLAGHLNLCWPPVWIDIYGNNFLHGYAWKFVYSCAEGTAPYTISMNFVFSRLIFIFLGIVFFIHVCKGPIKEA